MFDSPSRSLKLPSRHSTSIALCNRDSRLNYIIQGYKDTIEAGDLVLAFIGRENIKPIKVDPEATLQTRYGSFPHSAMVGKPYGSQIVSSKGYGFIYLLYPTAELWTISLPHRTQIVYTPDSSYIMQRLNVVSGSRVIEAGTGSGSFSHAFARTVGVDGRVFSYEFHEPRYQQALDEFADHGVTNLTLTHRDVCMNGFDVDETKVDADTVFLDLPSPWEAIPHLERVIAKDRRVGICCFSPCVEQVMKTVEALHAHGWTEVEMTEVAGKKWESRKEMVREVDDALERLRDVQKRQKEGLEKKKLIAEKMKRLNDPRSETERKRVLEEVIGYDEKDDKKAKKDYGFNPFSKGKRVMEGDEGFEWFDVSKTGPELKTHTSYLTFAYLVPETKAEKP